MTDPFFQVLQSPTALLTVNLPCVIDSIFPFSHGYPDHTLRIETRSHFAFDTYHIGKRHRKIYKGLLDCPEINSFGK